MSDGGGDGSMEEVSEKSIKAAETGGVGGARIVVILATESKAVAILDQG